MFPPLFNKCDDIDRKLIMTKIKIGKNILHKKVKHFDLRMDINHFLFTLMN